MLNVWQNGCKFEDNYNYSQRAAPRAAMMAGMRLIVTELLEKNTRAISSACEMAASLWSSELKGPANRRKDFNKTW